MPKLVKDGYFGDLDNDLQNKLILIHRLLKDAIYSLLEDEKDFKKLNNDEWAKSKIDEFLVMPIDKNKVGSVRVYNNKNKFSCMIQITGHFENMNENDTEQKLNKLINTLYEKYKKPVKDKFNLILRSEYKNGESFEGFDVWLVGEDAKKIWDLFEFKKVKEINKEKELDESVIYEEEYEYKQLPNQLKMYIKESIDNINNTLNILCEKAEDKYFKEDFDLSSIKDGIKAMSSNALDCIGETTLSGNGNYMDGKININTQIKLDNKAVKEIIGGLTKFFNENYTDNGLTKLVYNENDESLQLQLDDEYCKSLYEHLQNYRYDDELIFENDNNKNIMMESVEKKYVNKKCLNYKNINMKSESILESLCDRLLDNPTQFNLDIISKIFTEEFLPRLKNKFNKFQINLSDKPSSFFEVTINNLNEEFIDRLLENEDTISNLIHSNNNELIFNISPISFKNESSNNIINFLKNSIQFYSEYVDIPVNKLIYEYKLLPNKTKFIIENSDLKGILPMLLESLFIDNNFSFKESSLFKINKENINVLSDYLYTMLESKDCIDNCRMIIESIKSLNNYEVFKQIKNIPSSLEKYHNKELTDLENQYQIQFENSNIDNDWSIEKDKTIEYYQEGFFSKVKKLKKFPSDLIAYITIETEAIRDYNDKLLLASYTLSKIDMVEWYAELLETGSKNYIVPYTKDQLQRLRIQLLNCYKKIMAIKIVNPNQSTSLDDMGEPFNY